MVHRHVLYPDAVDVTAGRQEILGRERSQLVKITEKVAAVDLVFSHVVVALDHELVLVLVSTTPGIGQFVTWAVGQRYAIEKILRDRTQAPGWDLISQEWCVRQGILNLSTIRCWTKTVGV